MLDKFVVEAVGTFRLVLMLFAFVLAYMVFNGVEPRRNVPNSVWHFVIGIAVVAGTVDFSALFGGRLFGQPADSGCLYGNRISVVRVGGPLMCVEVHIFGATVVITAQSHSWLRRGVDVRYDYRKGAVRAMDQRIVGGQTDRGRVGLRRFRWALADS